MIYVPANGIGIESMYIDRIFNAFDRLHSKGTYLEKGMGLPSAKK